MTYAIIPAGGIGSRMGLDCPKQYYYLAGIPILIHTLRAFEAAGSIAGVIVVVPEAHVAETKELVAHYGLAKVKQVVVGGVFRQDSVACGLAVVPQDCGFVAVHDGARPLVSPGLIDACVLTAKTSGAAMAAVPVSDTLKEVTSGGRINCTVDRSCLWQAQTPQVVALDLLQQAFALAAEQDFIGTDEASFVELLGHEMMVVSGSETNIKVTRPDDLAIAEALLQGRDEENMTHPVLAVRIGHGYDAHQLVSQRPLVLGGVTIPHHHGLLGHSDADVLTHALCDAILGGLGLGDIGQHFPDSDPVYKGISSLVLLGHVMGFAAQHGYILGNADVTVIAQAPKLAPYWSEMVGNLAITCEVEPGQINLKGTTTERMGFAGREEGIAAHAVVTLIASGKIS